MGNQSSLTSYGASYGAQNPKYAFRLGTLQAATPPNQL